MKTAAILLLALALAGCGKGSGILGGSPFGGSWRGKYQDNMDEHRDGSLEMTIDSVGNIKATGSRNEGYSDFGFTGDVDKFGKFEGTLTGSYTGSFSGQLQITKDGLLKGKFKRSGPDNYPNYLEMHRPPSD